MFLGRRNWAILWGLDRRCQRLWLNLQQPSNLSQLSGRALAYRSGGCWLDPHREGGAWGDLSNNPTAEKNYAHKKKQEKQKKPNRILGQTRCRQLRPRPSKDHQGGTRRYQGGTRGTVHRRTRRAVRLLLRHASRLPLATKGRGNSLYVPLILKLSKRNKPSYTLSCTCTLSSSSNIW